MRHLPATTIAMFLASACAAFAEPGWQKPTVSDCTMAPGEDCNIEAACPADAPFVATGGGGMPKAEPADHSVAITMNLPVSENTWRVRWRNLSADQSATIKGAVRIRCAATAAEAGW